MKVGMTGHQQLGSDEIVTWLIDCLESSISEYHIDAGITSLAIGADQLYAEVLKKHHIPYSVVIPSTGYEKTFSDTYILRRYQVLLNAAFDNISLPFNEPSETAFYEAGKKIVSLSDMMIAIWNGLPAKGLGGTGDIVAYALSTKKRILHINPISRAIRVL